MKIQFFFQYKPVSILHRTALKVFIEKIFIKNKRPLESLTYIFCSDEELLEINKQFLKHNFYTDIITFNLSANQSPIVGEVYISVDRVKENTLQFKTTFKEELHRVIFHGALHLCGYKDKSKNDIKAMRSAELDCLTAYFK